MSLQRAGPLCGGPERDTNFGFTSLAAPQAVPFDVVQGLLDAINMGSGEMNLESRLWAAYPNFSQSKHDNELL